MNPLFTHPQMLAPPIAIYPDVDTGFAACQAHAKAHGYAFSRHDKKAKRVVFACDKAGKYNPKGKRPEVHTSRQRPNTGTKKCGCMMKVALVRDISSGTWELEVLEGEHNHEPSLHFSAHPAHRLAALTPEIRSFINVLATAGVSSTQILTTLRHLHTDLPLILKDVSNILQKSRMEARMEELVGRTPTPRNIQGSVLQPIDLADQQQSDSVPEQSISTQDDQHLH